MIFGDVAISADFLSANIRKIHGKTKSDLVFDQSALDAGTATRGYFLPPLRILITSAYR